MGARVRGYDGMSSRPSGDFMKGPVFGDWTFLVTQAPPTKKGPVSEDWTFLSCIPIETHSVYFQSG